MMTAKETTRGDNPAHVVRTLNDLLVEQEKILQRAPLALRISSKKVPQGNDVTGRLTDSQGRVVDFKNTVIIMTTNLGTRDITKGSLGFSAGPDGVATSGGGVCLLYTSRCV